MTSAARTDPLTRSPVFANAPRATTKPASPHVRNVKLRAPHARVLLRALLVTTSTIGYWWETLATARRATSHRVAVSCAERNPMFS